MTSTSVFLIYTSYRKPRDPNFSLFSVPFKEVEATMFQENKVQ